MENVLSGGKKVDTYRVATRSHNTEEQNTACRGFTDRHNAGEMDQACKHCKALLYPGETSYLCCSNGTLKSLPTFPDPPELLVALITGDHPCSESFLSHARLYNNLLALASLKADPVPFQGGGPQVYKVKGRMAHGIATSVATDRTPKFLQLYFHGPGGAEERDARMTNLGSRRADVNRDLLLALQEMLHACNPYVRRFKSLLETENYEDARILIVGQNPMGAHRRTYNAPTTEEVAVLVREGTEPMSKQDIVLTVRAPGPGEHAFQLMPSTTRCYDPLFYVLMFPRGSFGFDITLKDEKDKGVTMTKFHKFHFHTRIGSISHILQMRLLCQQYATEVYARISQLQLKWVREHQEELRSEQYKVVVTDAHARDLGINEIGKKVILPGTIVGSPRWYQAIYRDACEIVRQLGKPSWFITLTCNPAWPEITSALRHGQRASDRPDLTCRVFKLKFKALMADLLGGQVLGKVIAHLATVEFQKRGLPHAHILLIMAEEDCPSSAAETDDIVSAEIPNKEEDPRYHELVLKHMLHGPCGPLNPHSPCMEGSGELRRCAKNYPKEFASATEFDGTNYPAYRRRAPVEGGEVVRMKRGGREVVIDNGWTVPHNRKLLLRYEAHLNVECVATVAAVKYLYKYITKGPDRATFKQKVDSASSTVIHDEVSEFQDGRYISASEAYWRIYEFAIQSKYPPVTVLPVHGDGEQMVYFTSVEEARLAAQLPPSEFRSKLMAYFTFLSENEEYRDVLYQDIIRYASWDARDKRWRARTRKHKNSYLDEKGRRAELHLGRIPYFVLTSKNTELFFIRTLLMERPATSFEDLRTVAGVLHPTFRAAAVALGLTEDDEEANKVMEEVAGSGMPNVVRQTFVSLLVFLPVEDPRQLLEDWLPHLAEDFARREEEEGLDTLSPRVRAMTLQAIKDALEVQGRTMEGLQLPEPERGLLPAHTPAVIREETSYDEEELGRQAAAMQETLSEEQRKVYETVMLAVERGKPRVVSLNAIAGSGKTYLLNLLLKKTRSLGKVALATAFSGIAATLLDNGRTIHSRFRAPVELDAESTCRINKSMPLGELLARAELLVVDEVTMANRDLLMALHRTLVDVRSDKRSMGGLTTVLAGDWRQCLPVVKRGDRAAIVNACIKRCKLWPGFQRLGLTQNMRALLSGGATAEHAAFLFQLGQGQLPTHPDVQRFGENLVRIPKKYRLAPDADLEDLVDFTFCGFDQIGPKGVPNYQDADWISSRAIIVPLNSMVDEVNQLVMARLEGAERVYLSTNQLLEEDEGNNHSPEMLAALKVDGAPPHELRLKEHAPIMLLRNLDPREKLVNGSRLSVVSMTNKVIYAAPASNPAAVVALPRIDFKSDQTRYPFHFRRRQFPIRVSFAITSNKSQGQTLRRAGVWIPKPFFTHGQLYVAMSRVGNPDNLRVLIGLGPNDICGQEGEWTNNVVFPEVL